MGPVEKILRDASELITPEGALTTHFYARDANQNPTSPLSKRATCFCAIGAILRVYPNPVLEVMARELLHNTAVSMGFVDPKVEDPAAVFLNDSTNAELTPDLFSEAIECAEALGL
jgi:hypothetical protein